MDGVTVAIAVGTVVVFCAALFVLSRLVEAEEEHFR